PDLSTSKGFTLIAKVTSDPSSDLASTVNNRVVIAAHTGAGFNVAVLYPSNSSGSIFYQNGTAEQVASGETSIINDEATPPSPFGMQIQSAEQFDVTYPTEHSITINVGYGTKVSFEDKNGIQVLRNGLDEEGTGSFAVCNNTVPYYHGAFWTLMYLYPGEELAEETCVEVMLVPKCAVLEDLPEGSYSSHEFAVDVGCY
ncbi:hypothetical protein B0T16DRAFT_301215, partial [Cercophora newfieldiana]